MYTIQETNKMPFMELNTYTRFVAVVFCTSCVTAFTMALLRVVKPELYYMEPLQGSELGAHYMISGLLMGSSWLGLVNSLATLHRKPAENTGRSITRWLLVQSVFETSRVIYVFVGEVIFNVDKTSLHSYELIASAIQYLLDSCLYCQMVLKH